MSEPTAPTQPAGHRARIERSVRWLTAVATVGCVVSCTQISARTATPPAPAAPAAAGAATGSIDGAATVAAAEMANAMAPVRNASLAGRIAEQFQGAQLDVYFGGDPAPGGSTVMFFHQGSWAAEVYWKTDGWCLSRMYSWKVVDAVSETEFAVEYTVVEEHPDCVMTWGRHLTLEVHDAYDVGGKTVFDGEYTMPFQVATTRTACTARWDAPAPCGFDEPAALVTPPGS